MEDRQAGNTAGYIHSFQSLGAVDGPGLRYVVFMQGCPLRCTYCHNPDTWDLQKLRQSPIRRQRLWSKYGGINRTLKMVVSLCPAGRHSCSQNLQRRCFTF